MSINKQRRKQIWDKSKGKCWYCGDKLKDDWHVDHVIPKAMTYLQDQERHMQDGIDNLVPSCPPCNMLKHCYPLEKFRCIVKSQIEKCNANCTHYRTAKRYKLIKEQPKEIVFYFETINPPHNCGF